jgi:hypothetical protein
MEIAIGLAALFATLYGIRLAYRQNAPAQILAKRALEGGHKFSLAFNRTDVSHIVWVLPWAKYDRAFILEFEVSLFNEDTTDLEDVFLILEIPSDMYAPDMPRAFHNELRIVNVEQYIDPVTGREFTRRTFKFDVIQPNVRVLVTDFIWMRNSSRVRSSVRATARDGVDVEVAYQFILAREINLLVVAKDVRPYRRQLRIFSFDHDDPMLDNLKGDPALALDKAVAANIDWAKGEKARLFMVDAPNLKPDEFPPEAWDRIAKVSLRGMSYRMATFYPDMGYLPWLKSERAATRPRSVLRKLVGWRTGRPQPGAKSAPS